jgi:hypothetical protein
MIRRLNAEARQFPGLENRHMLRGYWWLAYTEQGEAVGFAGMVPFVPFDRLGVGFLKRSYMKPGFRGGMQAAFLALREDKARMLGWKMLVTDAGVDNLHSQRNLEAAGYIRCEPEQPWFEQPASVYYEKVL